MSITVKLQGGLGNQLFQYAFGKSVEKNTGTKVVFEDSDYLGDHPYRNYELKHFNVSADLVELKPQKSFLKKILRETLIFKSLRRKINIYKKAVNFEKLNVINSFEYDDDYKQLKDGSYIQGFFQNEKYFIDIADRIRKDFVLVTPLDELNKSILEDIRSTESISVHIRRGDYLELLKEYGRCTRDYYEKSIALIKGKLKDKKLKAFIFTDDPQWVKKHINFNMDTYYVDNNIGKGYFDLELMKNCKHNIIANSSFSWWGGWLNDNPYKIVIAPNPWFLCNESDFELIPNSWIRINGLSDLPECE